MEVRRLVLIRYKVLHDNKQDKDAFSSFFFFNAPMVVICFQGQVNRSQRFRFVLERCAKSVIRRRCAKRLNGIYYKSWLHIRAETDSTGMMDSHQLQCKPPVYFLNVGYILTRYTSVSCCHVLQNRRTLVLFDLGCETRCRTGRRLQRMIRSFRGVSQAGQKPSALTMEPRREGFSWC